MVGLTSPTLLQLALKMSSTVGLALDTPLIYPRLFCCHFGGQGDMAECRLPSDPG